MDENKKRDAVRTIIIGASRGIGAATALLVGKSKEGAEVVANEIEPLRSKAFVKQADISKPNEISQMLVG